MTVTGAAGYIGSRLVQELDDGPVRAITRDPVGTVPTTAEQVTLDLLGDVDELTHALEGTTTLVHLAGHNETVIARDPDRSLGETLTMARRVAEAATRAGVQRVVYASTVHVFGEQLYSGAHITATMSPEPNSTYGISRLACEQLLHRFEGELVVLRLTNVVGPPTDVALDRWTLVASDLCRQAVVDGALTLRTSGLQSRDFVDLGDVARSIAACSSHEGPPAGVYNLGSGRSMTIRELAAEVQDVHEARTGERIELHAPAPDGPPPPPCLVSVEELRAHGVEQPTSIRQSLTDLHNFCLDHRDEL